MTNNDIIRRLRYAFDYTNSQMAKVMGHVDSKIVTANVRSWINLPDDEFHQPLSDTDLCKFLDGLIIEKRGARPGAAIPKPLQTLSSNEILKKLRIALELREEGMMEVFKNAGFVVTKAELGSFFRKEGQRNYAECPEQVLRKFLHGLGKTEG